MVSARTCPATTSRDAAGVITTNGAIGIIGDTRADDAGEFLIVRRNAIRGDQIRVQFDQLSTSAPAKWVAYGITATAKHNPWSEVAYPAGYKPIGFAGSCWRLVVDGSDSGIVLEVIP
jgi:hypothetical protein